VQQSLLKKLHQPKPPFDWAPSGSSRARRPFKFSSLKHLRWVWTEHGICFPPPSGSSFFTLPIRPPVIPPFLFFPLNIPPTNELQVSHFAGALSFGNSNTRQIFFRPVFRSVHHCPYPVLKCCKRVLWQHTPRLRSPRQNARRGVEACRFVPSNNQGKAPDSMTVIELGLRTRDAASTNIVKRFPLKDKKKRFVAHFSPAVWSGPPEDFAMGTSSLPSGNARARHLKILCANCPDSHAKGRQAVKRVPC